MAVEDELLRIFQKSENKGGPATENTLQDLVSAFERFSGQSGTANRNNTTATNTNTSATQNNTQGVRQSTKSFKDLNRDLKMFTRDLTGIISDFADVGNSLTSAARTLDNIPVIGAHLATILGAVARASEGLANSFINAAQSGATFAGTVTNFARAASSAGMTLDQFGSLIQSNSESLLGLGTTTEAGANRFARLSRQLIDTGDDLYALGFNTQGINEGFLRYTKLLRLQGIQQNRTDSELLAGTQDYMKTLDSLAKVTGKQRDQIAAEQEQIAANAQFQAAMAGASDETRRSFMELISVLPSEELKSLAMDVLATGTITQEQNRLIGSQFQGFFQNLTGLNQQLRSDQALSMGQLNNIINGLRGEAGALQGTFGNILGSNEELFVLQQAITSALRLQENAVLNANAEQGRSIDQTQEFIETLSQAQQDIARLGNFFTVALAQSGLLPFLLDSFVSLGNFVHAFILPVFRALGSFIDGFFTPILFDLNRIFRAIGDTVGPVFQHLSNAITSIGRVAGSLVVPALIGLAAAAASSAFMQTKLGGVLKILHTMGGLPLVLKRLGPVLIASINSMVGGAFKGIVGGLKTFAKMLLGPVGIGVAVASIALALFSLDDPIFEFKMAMAGLNDWFANFFQRITNDEYKRRVLERDRQRAERDRQRREDNAFNGQIDNYNALYDVQQRDLQARKDLSNYSNPVDEFMQFAKQQDAHDLVTKSMDDKQRADYFENIVRQGGGGSGQQPQQSSAGSSAGTSAGPGTRDPSTIVPPSELNPIAGRNTPADFIQSEISRVGTQLESFTDTVLERDAQIAELQKEVTPEAVAAAEAIMREGTAGSERASAKALLSRSRRLENMLEKQQKDFAEIDKREAKIRELEQRLAEIKDPSSTAIPAGNQIADTDTTATTDTVADNRTANTRTGMDETSNPPSPTITQTAATNTAGGLNNVSTLIELMKRNNELARRQIGATEALSNDLFRAIG